MSDMNSLTMILLAEACLILLIALVAVLWIQNKSKGKHKKAVEQLISQIKKQSKTRTEETGSFLQEVYDLSDNELTVAVQSIDKQERRFFQKLVDVLTKSDPHQITSLDASVAELVDTYKSLKPKPVEAVGAVDPSDNDDLELLRVQNTNLKEELKTTQATMAGMIAEFGNMFGGGQDHDLDSSEVADKVVVPGKLPEDEEVKSEEKAEESSQADVDGILNN